MNHPFFSVLMPVYNSAAFLRDAIESILNQTFGDFEFIIIDDGSTDSSDDIIRSYRDERIRYFRNGLNAGITYTLNRGIGLAKADWIARMDADDISFSERLQKQHDFIQLHPDGKLFSSDVVEIDESKSFVRYGKLEPTHYFYNLHFAACIYHPTMVYSRKAVDSIGRYRVPYSEDWELAWQIAGKYKIYHQPEILLQYRLTSESLWQKTKKSEYRDAMLVQARRNLGYYLGEKFRINDLLLKALIDADEVEYRDYTINEVLACSRIIGRITKKIASSGNLNVDRKAITEAGDFKKNYLLHLSGSQFSKSKRILLFILSGDRSAIWSLIEKFRYKFSASVKAFSPFRNNSFIMEEKIY